MVGFCGSELQRHFPTIFLCGDLYVTNSLDIVYSFYEQLNSVNDGLFVIFSFKPQNLIIIIYQAHLRPN